MKKALEKISTVLRAAAGVVCAIFTVTFIVLIFTEKPVEVFAFMAVLFAGLTALLLFPRKKTCVSGSTDQFLGSVSVSFTPQEVPAETLRDMRKHYTPMQAGNDARILAESFQLCQQTYDFSTFFSRLQLTTRCAYTLLQAKQAGCKINRQTVKACESVLSARNALMLDFLDRIYEKETTDAMRLKTEAGQRRRLEALLNKLQEYNVDFLPVEDAYNEYLKEAQQLIGE